MKSSKAFRKFIQPAFFVGALATSSLVSYGALALLFLRQDSEAFTVTIAMWSFFFFASGSLVGWQALIAQSGLFGFNQKFDVIKIATKAPLVLFLLALGFTLVDIFIFTSFINAIAVLILGLIGALVFSTFNGLQFKLGNSHLVAFYALCESVLRLILIFAFSDRSLVQAATAMLLVSPSIIMAGIQSHKTPAPQQHTQVVGQSLFWTSLTFPVANLLLMGFPFLAVSFLGEQAHDLGAAFLLLALIRAPAVLVGYSGQPALVNYLSNGGLERPLRRLTAILFVGYFSIILAASAVAANLVPGTGYWQLTLTFGVSGILFLFLFWETARLQVSSKSFVSGFVWILVLILTCFALIFSPASPLMTIHIATILPAAVGLVILWFLKLYGRRA